MRAYCTEFEKEQDALGLRLGRDAILIAERRDKELKKEIESAKTKPKLLQAAV